MSVRASVSAVGPKKEYVTHSKQLVLWFDDQATILPVCSKVVFLKYESESDSYGNGVGHLDCDQV